MRSLFAGAMLLLALGGSAFAQDRGFVTTNVNLRAGPGTAYPAVLVLGEGTPLTIFGCLEDYSWCDVAADDYRGWVSAQYIESDYRGRRVEFYDYAPTIGVPIIAFSFNDYWGRYYRGRPWYSTYDRWGPPRRPPPGPGWGGPPPHGGGPGWNNGRPPQNNWGNNGRPPPGGWDNNGRPPQNNWGNNGRPPQNNWNGRPPQGWDGRPPEGKPPQGKPPQGWPQQGQKPPQGKPPQGKPPQGKPPQYGMPPHGGPSQGPRPPQQGKPPQGKPPQQGQKPPIPGCLPNMMGCRQ